jgi:hypothetical protein
MIHSKSLLHQLNSTRLTIRRFPIAYWFANYSMSTKKKYMLFKNGIKQSFDKPGSVFLKEYPRGGYSVMRTVKQGKCILQYPIHTQRLGMKRGDNILIK